MPRLWSVEVHAQGDEEHNVVGEGCFAEEKPAELFLIATEREAVRLQFLVSPCQAFTMNRLTGPLGSACEPRVNANTSTKNDRSSSAKKTSRVEADRLGVMSLINPRYYWG